MKKITLLYFAVLLLPLLGFVTGDVAWQEVGINARRLRLLTNSCLLAALSAVGCMVIGVLAAVRIHNSPLRNRKSRWFFLLLAPVPYYVYALTWMYLVRMAGRIDRSIMSRAASGLLPCLFVNILSFLPVATGLILAAMEQYDRQSEEMALVYARGNRVFWRVVLPGIMPMVTSAGALVFVLSATDFSVPSLFQYQTYTLEIFSEYSRGGNLGDIAILAIPLIALVLMLVRILERGIESLGQRSTRMSKKGMELTGGLRGVGSCAVGLCVLQIVIPLIMFLLQIEDWGNLWESICLCYEELFISIIIALLAAISAVLLAGPTGVWLTERKPIWRLFAVFPLALPSSLIAMGLLSVVNGSVIHWLSQTVYFPALGCAIKFMPFVLLIFVARTRRLPRHELELARLYAPSFWKYLTRALLPMYKSAILSSAALVFLLTLGEEGGTLVLMPPGYETLAVKVYTYLHYGASELVSGFCLITVLFTAGMMVLLGLLLGRKGFRRSEGGTK